MVAIIKTGSSIRATFFYNENKVKDGIADCIMAKNYPMDLEVMNENHRLKMLLKIASANENVTRNSVHISLNFAAEDQLSRERLQEIATEYMEGIGFGKQPYLVYQHHDAGHNHIHIVSIKVRPDGSRIDMNNIGRNQSETARKQIEQKYGLVRAEDHRKGLFQMKPVNALKVQYGKAETRAAIAAVLDAVVSKYRYTSLAELNAVLKQYNVYADRGDKDSRTHKHGGLFYRALDNEGNPVGVPIKASLFPDKPTLKFLEGRFVMNDTLRQPHKDQLRTEINYAMYQPRLSLQTLKRELGNQGIDMVLRQNHQGDLYGVSFVDHRTKCVWNGSDLGKQYSIKGLLERLRERTGLIQKHQVGKTTLQASSNLKSDTNTNLKESFSNTPAESKESLLEAMLRQEQGADYLPPHLCKKKQKKKGKSLGL